MNMKKTKSEDKKILEIPAVYVSRTPYVPTVDAERFLIV